jgi:GSH-dependent disulfide-bond oxidoreductase
LRVGCAEMGMILYHGEPNGPSLAVLAALFESGVEAETRRIDLLKGERHAIPGITEPLARDMGVEGEGPVLVVDGEAMTESVFIAQFLDESGAGTLQPKDPFALWQMLMWCRRVTERCAPAAAYLGCKAFSRVGDFDLASIASEDLRARWADLQAGHFSDEATTDSIRHVTATVEMVEGQLADDRDWLMGEFSIADLETYGWLAAMPHVVPEAFEGRPKAAAWIARIKARPSITQVLSLAQGEAETHWAPGPEINRWG